MQGLELTAAMGRMRGQRQRRQHRMAVSIPQCVSPLHRTPGRSRVTGSARGSGDAPIGDGGATKLANPGARLTVSRWPENDSQSAAGATTPRLVDRASACAARLFGSLPVPHAIRDLELVEHLEEPSHRARGFKPNHHWRRQARIKLADRLAFVPQRRLNNLPPCPDPASQSSAGSRVSHNL